MIHRILPAWFCLFASLLVSFPVIVNAAEETPAPAPPPIATPADATPAETPPWSGPFFFIVMADPQFGMYDKDKTFTYETDHFEKAIAAANRLKPALLVIAGDLINKTGDTAQTNEFLRIVGQLDKSIPLALLAGNHDVANVPTPETLAHYRKTFGKDQYALDLRGCHFLTLNSTIIHRPERVAQEAGDQLQWVKDDLEATRKRETQPAHVFVLLHHPLFRKDAQEKDEYGNIPLASRSVYLNLFEDAGVTAVFAGHHHDNALAKTGKMEMVTTGPVGKPLGKAPSGFRIVKVYRDRIEHEYVALDAVPEKVELKDEAAASN